MKKEEIKIGTHFLTGVGEWICTDVGTRTIVAISLNDADERELEAGPPYSVCEYVFDEYDFEVLEVVPLEG